jgi:proline-specific peptidase
MYRRVLALLLAAASVACGDGTQKPAPNAGTPDVPAPAAPAGVVASGSAAKATIDTQIFNRPAMPKGEGFVRMQGGRTWYKLSGTGNGLPAILIHDGPGASSFALKSLEGLGSDRPVLRYDQLGGGRSSSVFDRRVFTIPHYVAELDSLRAHLGAPKVHLVAHSFGGVIALEYYKAHPEYVASLTLESPEFDFPALRASIAKRIQQLPEPHRTLLAQERKYGTTEMANYRAALLEFVKRNVCCHSAIGPDVDSTALSMNDTAYSVLRGPNEVGIDGLLANYSATPILKSIRVPVLLTVGEEDVSDPPTVQRFASQTPNARVVVIKGAMHFPMWDAPDENLRVVRDFLRQADTGRP